jgi:hypothetical protein
MKVIINGLPLFSSRLAADLRSVAPNDTIRFHDTYNSNAARLKFALDIRNADVFISMNGVSDRSGSLDLVMKKHVPMMMLWMGTDVSLAMGRYRDRSIHLKYIEYAHHFTDSPLLKHELESIGVKANTLHFKWIRTNDYGKNVFPALSAFTYIGQGKADFYGWQQVRELAIAFPEISFKIAGNTGVDFIDIPKNLMFLGWIDSESMKQLRNETPIFIRLPEHDGFSMSVLEAMGSGCDVIWNQELNGCHLFNSNAPIEQFASILDTLKLRNLSKNSDNIQFIASHFEKQQILQNFLQTLKTFVK